jgi:hypothetical protein
MANYNYYFLYVTAYPVEIWVLIIKAFIYAARAVPRVPDVSVWLNS